MGTYLLGSAGAHPSNWANSGCKFSFTDEPVSRDIRVKAELFPANGYGDGVLNSFTNRTKDAIADWDNQFTGQGIPGGVIWATSSPDVTVRYEDISGVLGRASYTTGLGSSCPVHGYYNNMMYVTIRIDTLSTWFTQDDSRRSHWEGCVPGSNYTCSKTYDYGSTITHEIGHAITLRDVQDVNSHVGSSTPTNVAGCSTANDQATMCGNAYTYQTSRRTLAPYDQSSFSSHFASL